MRQGMPRSVKGRNRPGAWPGPASVHLFLPDKYYIAFLCLSFGCCGFKVDDPNVIARRGVLSLIRAIPSEGCVCGFKNHLPPAVVNGKAVALGILIEQEGFEDVVGAVAIGGKGIGHIEEGRAVNPDHAAGRVGAAIEVFHHKADFVKAGIGHRCRVVAVGKAIVEALFVADEEVVVNEPLPLDNRAVGRDGGFGEVHHGLIHRHFFFIRDKAGHRAGFHAYVGGIGITAAGCRKGF